MLVKLELLGYCMVINYDDMLSRFHLVPERNGCTDRRTDRFAISISRVSMMKRDKNVAASRLKLQFFSAEHCYENLVMYIWFRHCV